MKLAVNFIVESSGLWGFPYEFHPRLAVWTTNTAQPMTVQPGKAVDVVELEEPPAARSGPDAPVKMLHGKKSVFFTPASPGSDKRPAVPIIDPSSELCVSMFVSSRFGGGGDQKRPPTYEEEPRDYTVELGQINIPWHVILRFLVSDGHASLSRGNDKEITGTSYQEMRLFPRTRVTQELSSLALVDGVRYNIKFLRATGHKKMAIELEKMDVRDLTHKATISLIVGIVCPSGIEPETCLELLEEHIIANRPYRERERKHGLDKFVFALKLYDEKTAERARIITEALTEYQARYEKPWVQSNRVRLLVLPAGASPDDDAATILRPDVPSMGRFHLPTWVCGDERYPFAMWWFGTLHGIAGHLPEPTVKTEHWLHHLLALAQRRARIDSHEFNRIMVRITHKAHEASPEMLYKLALRGTLESNSLIRCLEALSYLASMVAHNCRYSNDVQRGSRKFGLGHTQRHTKRRFTFDAETPQHNTAAGIADEGDCEDMEKLIAIIGSLLAQGRMSGDQETRGRGWATDGLLACYHAAQLIVRYHHFGPVMGAQIKDAEGKENEEGLIGDKVDMSNDIGGHMYAFTESVVRLSNRYAKHRSLVMRLTGGTDLSAELEPYIRRKLMYMVRDNEDQYVLLRNVWANMPAWVDEGTGRQEPFLLPTERYFGITPELLQRTGSHASNIEILQRWPRPAKPTHASTPTESEDEEEEEEEQSEGAGDDSGDEGESMTKLMKRMKREAETRRVPNRSIPIKVDRTADTAAAAASHLTIPDPMALGEALPYAFQRRILSESRFVIDVTTHMRFERHVSPFYRRLAHSCSDMLKRISPGVFDHMIWVAPKRLTYGPTLREFLEDGTGDEALPIPLGNLSDAYMRTNEQQDAMHHMMRRVIPYDLSFGHITDDEFETLMSVTAAANHTLSPASSSSSASPPASMIEKLPFFAQTLLSHRAPGSESAFLDGVTSAANFVEHHELAVRSSGKNRGSGGDTVNSGNSDDSLPTHTIYVSSTGPIAQVIQTVGAAHGKPNSVRWEGVASSCINVLYRNERQVENLKQHILSGQGITSVEIVRERVLPNMADTLSAYFDRRIAFEIDDTRHDAELAKATATSKNTMMVPNHDSASPPSNTGFRRWSHLLPSPQSNAQGRKGRHTVDRDQKFFTIEQVRKVMKKLSVNPDVVSEDLLWRGMEIEYEHGSKSGEERLNVTRDDATTTARIALAHLAEFPDLRESRTGRVIIANYYDALGQLETSLDDQWRKLAGAPKPSIWLRSTKK